MPGEVTLQRSLTLAAALTVVLPAIAFAQSSRLALTVPTAAGHCETQPAPGPSLLGQKEVRAAVIGDSPTAIRIVMVTRDPTSKLTVLTNMQGVAKPDGSPDLVTVSVNIDSTGVMTGRDAKPDTWRLGPSEEKTVRSIITWYNTTCATP